MCYFTRQAQKNTIYSDYTELHVLIEGLDGVVAFTVIG